MSYYSNTILRLSIIIISHYYATNLSRHIRPPLGRQHSLVKIDHEIFSTIILSILLIQEEQLSVSGKRMFTNTG